MGVTRALKSRRINFRISEAEAELLHRGAKRTGKNLTEFIVESACTVAELEVAEQSSFKLPPEKWKAFLAALDNPARPTAELRRLMTEPSAVELANRRKA